MTPDEIEAHKEKIKKVMLDHLTTLGYPDMHNEAIMAELKPMWVKLEEAGLILPEMTFLHFVDHANTQFLFAEMKGVMGI